VRGVRRTACLNVSVLWRGEPVRAQVLRPVRCAARTTPTAKSVAPESYTPKHLAEKILTSKAALEGERKQVTMEDGVLKAP